MLTKNITEVVVYFGSDEDGMKRYEEFTAEQFRGLFEQLEAARETFRLIAEACGEDGTAPEDWKAMTHPTPGEAALRAVRELREDYNAAIDDHTSNPAEEPHD